MKSLDGERERERERGGMAAGVERASVVLRVCVCVFWEGVFTARARGRPALGLVRACALCESVCAC